MYLADVFFREINTSKLRPVIVVSNSEATDADVIVVPATGQSQRSKFDVFLRGWKDDGLHKPTVARTSKIFTIGVVTLRTQIGALTPNDLTDVTAICRDLF